MELVIKGMKILLLIAIPFEIVMLLQGEALVSLAFARGAFDEKAIELTTLSFIFFSLALPFFALRDYLMNAFYSLNKTKTALLSCVYAVAINIVLSIVLSQWLYVGGVALATSIAMTVQSIYLYYKLREIENHTGKSAFLVYAVKLLAIFLLVLGIVYSINRFTPYFSTLVNVTLTSIVVFGLYLLFLYLFKVQELKLLSQLIRNRGGTK